MLKEESIVVGCNDKSTLPVILDSLNSISDYHFISTTRISDLIGIIKTLHPILIIIHYRNNQKEIDLLSPVLKKLKIPIVCLMKKSEQKSLRWDTRRIVFTIPLAHISINNYLSSRILSMLLLMKKAAKKSKRQSFITRHLENDILNYNKKLSRYALELDQKTTTLMRVKEEIKELYGQVENPARKRLMSLVSEIKESTGDKNHWDDFKLYFESINPNYVRTLSDKHPDLTTKDIKYCCYLKMNMSNHDIRHILGINQESVRTHKYRLKKKMSLAKNQDLHTYAKFFNFKKA